jgi:hypothetical protein
MPPFNCQPRHEPLRLIWDFAPVLALRRESRQKSRADMIISPKIRGFICTTAHPDGCAAHVQEQIDYVKSKPALAHGPKRSS